MTNQIKQTVIVAALLTCFVGCDDDDDGGDQSQPDASTRSQAPIETAPIGTDAAKPSSTSSPQTSNAFGGAEACAAPKGELLFKVDGETDDAALVGNTMYISTTKGLISVDLTTQAQTVVHPSPNFRHMCTLNRTRVFVDHVGAAPMGVPDGNPEIVDGRLASANLYADFMVEAGAEMLVYGQIDFDGKLQSFDGTSTGTVAKFGARISGAAASNTHYFAIVDPYDGKPSIHRVPKQGPASDVTIASSPDNEEIGIELAAIGDELFFVYDRSLSEPSTLASVPAAGGAPTRLAGPLNAPFFYPQGGTLYVHAGLVGGGSCLYRWSNAERRLTPVAANTCGAACNAVLADEAHKQLYLVGPNAVYRVAMP